MYAKTTLSLAILGLSLHTTFANTETSNHTDASSTPVQTLETLKIEASNTQVDHDISAVAKTIISRDEMLKFGDQSIQDALRRAAGFQMGSPGGRGPGGGAMRFRGGGAPIYLINGEPVEGGPRGGMSIVDSITPEMIERIELTKQPSVAQASVAASAIINIILKEPLNTSAISGSVRLGYGLTKSDEKESERKSVSLQMDGRSSPWMYSLSANQSWDDNVSVTQISTESGEQQQKRSTERQSSMLTPRLEYTLDDQQKLVAELFLRSDQRDGITGSTLQKDENESVRLNTRYERKDGDNTDKLRFGIEKQKESELTRSTQRQTYIKEDIENYSLAYDAVRKFNPYTQVKFGTDIRQNQLNSNIDETLDEARYALYAEGSYQFTDAQTLTLGVRQEWLDRSGLVEYSDQHLSPVIAHRFNFAPNWSLQTNLSQAFRSPNSNQLSSTISVSTDLDAGSLNNPDRGGNPFLKPEKINAIESTLGFNTPSGGFNLTGYYRQIDDYIERTIRSENASGQICVDSSSSECRFVERPRNQSEATTYGVELSGRYALKQTENGHSFMLNSQISTVRARIEQDNGQDRLASGVAPYTASIGASYNYQPWQLSTSLNVSYVPEFTRALDSQDYLRTSNERVNVDLSVMKRFKHDISAGFQARNILSMDYKERLTNINDGSLYQARNSEAIPSFQFNLEKKF